MLHCPNCSSPIAAEPVQCSVCGYRSDRAREYLWMYLGGAVFIAVGFALGAFGVACEGAAPGHWSRELAWFPLAPWPEFYHWLAFLVTGIGFTLGGLGLTRRRWSAWLFLLLLTLYEAGLAAAAAAGMIDAAASRGNALILSLAAATLCLLLIRIGAAFGRTPIRDAARLQELARQAHGGEREAARS